MMLSCGIKGWVVLQSLLFILRWRWISTSSNALHLRNESSRWMRAVDPPLYLWFGMSKWSAKADTPKEDENQEERCLETLVIIFLPISSMLTPLQSWHSGLWTPLLSSSGIYEVFNFLNKLFPSICFIVEVGGTSINFLDVTVQINSGTHTFGIFRSQP